MARVFRGIGTAIDSYDAHAHSEVNLTNDQSVVRHADSITATLVLCGHGVTFDNMVLHLEVSFPFQKQGVGAVLGPVGNRLLVSMLSRAGIAFLKSILTSLRRSTAGACISHAEFQEPSHCSPRS